MFTTGRSMHGSMGTLMTDGRLARLRRTAACAFCRSLPIPTLSASRKPSIACERLLSSRHTTDVYLLALAIAHGMRFVTLDRSVSANAVFGADERSLVVL